MPPLSGIEPGVELAFTLVKSMAGIKDHFVVTVSAPVTFLYTKSLVIKLFCMAISPILIY
jgi:hypothetical protein